MKKVFLLLLPLFWAFMSCKNDSLNQEKNQKKLQDTIIMLKVDDIAIDRISQIKVPELQDSLNTLFLTNYKEFATEYLHAMQKNDTQKIRIMQSETESWSEKTKIFVNKLSSNELHKTHDFMRQLSAQLDSLQKR